MVRASREFDTASERSIEKLIMINAENAGRGRDDRQPCDLRQEESGRNAGHNGKRGKSVRNGHASAQGPSRNLGALPFNWKGNWSAADDTEVVTIVGVLPDVLAVDHEVLAECLLESGVEFIAHTGLNRSQVTWNPRRWNQRSEKGNAAAFAGDDQVLVERCFHGPTIRDPQYGIGFLHVVGDPHARLRLACGGKAVVDVTTESQIEGPILFSDCVLHVHRELLYVRVTAKEEWRSAHGEVVRSEDGARSTGDWMTACIEARRGNRRNQRWIDNGNGVILIEKCLLICDAGLHVVASIRKRTCMAS